MIARTSELRALGLSFDDGLLETYGKRAPVAAMQLQWALDAPIGSPPPDGGKRLTIVRSDKGERKAA